MIKHTSKILLLVILLIGCETDNGTEPVTTQQHDQALVGKWVLSKSKLNGNTVNYENLCDCPFEFQFDANGTGIVWKRIYGVMGGSKSFGWSTSGDKLTIHEVNEYPLVATYTVTEDSYTMTYENEGIVEITYIKL